MDVLSALVADLEAAKLVDPGVGAFHHPAVMPQPLARFDPAAGDPWNDETLFQPLTQGGTIISLVCVQFVRVVALTLPHTERRQCIDQGQQVLAIGGIGPRLPDDQRQTVAVYHKVALRARFAAVRRVRPCGSAPFGAGTLELSTQTRLQSMRSAI